MAKHSKSERAEALVGLRELFKPGDSVHLILESVSRSGMSRSIRVLAPYVRTDDGQIDYLHPNHLVSVALGVRRSTREGVIMGGCGMDMGFALVYELAHALYPQYQCLGKGKCPSSYHVNHRERVRCDGAEGRFCWKPDRFSSRFPVPEGWPYTEETVTVEGDDGQPLSHTFKRLLACLSTGDDSIGPVCPTCKGVGDLPNPDGPERFDLLHTDGYALKHRWL